MVVSWGYLSETIGRCKPDKTHFKQPVNRKVRINRMTVKFLLLLWRPLLEEVSEARFGGARDNGYREAGLRGIYMIKMSRQLLRC